MPYLFNLSALASHEHEHHELEGILMTLTPICVKAFAETKSRMKSQFEAGVTKYCAQSSGWQHLRSFQNQTCKGPIFGGRSFPPVTGTIARWWVIRVTRQTPETNKERERDIYIYTQRGIPNPLPWVHILLRVCWNKTFNRNLESLRKWWLLAQHTSPDPKKNMGSLKDLK